jgi:lysophospholipase L1-like esterase
MTLGDVTAAHQRDAAGLSIGARKSRRETTRLIAGLLISAFLFFVPGASRLKAAQEIPDSSTAQFRAGDRWCAVGDSITHTGFYTDYIYLFYATRFPDRPIDFFNCGSAGDTAKGTVARLQKDILRHHPTVATIMLGMNDVRRGFYSSKFNPPDAQAQRDAAIEVHVANMRTLAEKLQAAGARLIFITPSIFDDTVEFQSEKYSGVNAALARCSENARKLAKEFNAPLVDFHGPMTRLNREQQKLNPKFTLIGPDRIHPKEIGSFVMAYLFLKGQGITPFVSDVVEDAAGKDQCSFTYQAKALPFPVPIECVEALKLVAFTEELNQERLRITNLASGKYQLTIDGKAIKTFASAELQNGINLASLTNTPQYQQALEVAKLDVERYKLVQILRTLDFLDAGINPNYGTTDEFDYAAVLAKRKSSPSSWGQRLWVEYAKYKPQQAAVRQQKEKLVEAIRQASQPKPHQFKVLKE